MRILGLDVSTSTIGVGCLDVSGPDIFVVSIDHYKPPKDGDVFERLDKTRKAMKNIIKSFQPDIIAIEDIIQFMGAGSSAATIIALAQVNRTVGLVAYDFLKRTSPRLLSVMAVRHGIKLTKDLPSKEDIPELIEKRLGIEFPYVINKKGKIAPESNDRADGAAVALYVALEQTGQLYKQMNQKAKKAK
jgi:hypothetical protein